VGGPAHKLVETERVSYGHEINKFGARLGNIEVTENDELTEVAKEDREGIGELVQK